MKKLFLLNILIILTIIFSSCTYNGISNTENDTEETETIYENKYKIDQLYDAYGSQNYELIEQLANEIISDYPDTADSVIAETLLKISNESKEKAKKEQENTDYKKYIQLISAYTDEPNIAGGVDLHIKWKNTSDKTIKYITFSCNLYNAVDDIIADTITNSYRRNFQVTGPIEPGTVYGDNYLWENAWWNNSGKYPKIIGINVEYMDGTEIEIPQDKIDELFY